MLKREFGSRLGATGDEYIGYTIEGALRMEQLLKDLRAYTLASTSGLEPAGDVDSGESLDKALANLAVAIKESGASITRSDLPCVRMHDFQLEQLFQNLVGNAIRYRSGEPPQIHIAAERQGKDWLFSVRDNGIGILRNTRSKFLNSSNVSTASPNIPVPAWAWRSANELSSAPGGGSGWIPNPAAVRRFSLQSRAEIPSDRASDQKTCFGSCR